MNPAPVFAVPDGIYTYKDGFTSGHVLSARAIL